MDSIEAERRARALTAHLGHEPTHDGACNSDDERQKQQSLLAARDGQTHEVAGRHATDDPSHDSGHVRPLIAPVARSDRNRSGGRVDRSGTLLVDSHGRLSRSISVAIFGIRSGAQQLLKLDDFFLQSGSGRFTLINEPLRGAMKLKQSNPELVIRVAGAIVSECLGSWAA
jgi:hypothetical protein